MISKVVREKNQTKIISLEYINLETLFVSILLGAVVIFSNIEVANVSATLYFLLCVKRGTNTVGWLINFTLFFSFSLFAVHQYDVRKISQWAIMSVSPIIVMSLFLHVPKYNVKKIEKALNWIMSKLKIHWLFGAMIIAEIITVLIRDIYSIYGGTFLILICTALFFNSEDKKVIRGTLVMVTIYTIFINLISWKGLFLLKEEALSFVYAFWSTLVIPYIYTYIFFLHNAKSAKSTSLIKQEEELITANVN